MIINFSENIVLDNWMAPNSSNVKNFARKNTRNNNYVIHISTYQPYQYNEEYFPTYFTQVRFYNDLFFLKEYFPYSCKEDETIEHPIKNAQSFVDDFLIRMSKLKVFIQ